MASTTTETPQPQPTGCCPPFDPEPWQGRELKWHDKMFLKDRVFTLFHIPLSLGRHITQDVAQIRAAGAATATNLMLTEEVNPFRTDLYIDVARPVPGATMETLSGRFLTRVFEGPYNEMGKWAREMRDSLASRGEVLERLYFAYTTCPACAKAYGKNYVVLFAKVKEPVPV